MNCLECSIEAARAYLTKRAARPIETQLSLVF